LISGKISAILRGLVTEKSLFSYLNTPLISPGSKLDFLFFFRVLTLDAKTAYTLAKKLFFSMKIHLLLDIHESK